MSNYAFLGKKVSKTWKWGKGRAEYPFIIILKNCLTGLRKDNLGKYSFFFFFDLLITTHYIPDLQIFVR